MFRYCTKQQYLQCFDTVGWATGSASGLQKSWVLSCWWWQFDWSFARLIAAVITTTSVTLSANKIQNGVIVVPANPNPPGKWPLKGREEAAILYTNCNNPIFSVCYQWIFYVPFLQLTWKHIECISYFVECITAILCRFVEADVTTSTFSFCVTSIFFQRSLSGPLKSAKKLRGLRVQEFSQTGCPSCHPANSVKALKGCLVD